MNVVLARQQDKTIALATAVTSSGTPLPAIATAGYNGTIMLETVAVGTVAAQAVTFNIEGSFDGANFYLVGYYRVDAQATLTRAAAALTFTPGNGTVRQVYQVLDAYPWMRINPTANTLAGGGAGLTVTTYALPA